MISVPAQKITISGRVVERGSQEALVGAHIRLGGEPFGVSTNNYGFFSLTTSKKDTFFLTISTLGYTGVSRTYISPSRLTDLLIELEPTAHLLPEVLVNSQADEANRLGTLSAIKLNPQQVSNLPALLGEKDVIKILQLFPGVQKGTEGSTALYVRGGGPDQNLILLDDAPVYNANHLFGFFSVFNHDALNSIEFYKGGFPAQYGGRASSVLDIRMKEGSRKRLTGSGGIGLIASRFTLEGPINRKSSFLLSARRTYLDVIAKPLQSKSSRTGYFFYDLNTKVNFELTNKDKLYLSGYFGNDQLSIFSRTGVRTITTSISGMGWGNATASVRWNHLFTSKLFLNTTLYGSHYRFKLSDEVNRQRPEGTQILTSEYASQVKDYGLRLDWDFFPSNQHTLKVGAHFAGRYFRPRAFTSFNSQTGQQQEVTQQFIREDAIYVSDQFQPNPRFTANAGLRLVRYQNKTLRNLPLEPRLQVGYKLLPNWLIKGSYARMNQFVHVLSNTGAGLPTDLWVPATASVPAQRADQVVLGIDHTIKPANLVVTVEAYYKRINQMVTYRQGATFLVLGDESEKFDWESNVTSGRGWSYGTEVLLQRSIGKLTGWMGYTLSWTQRQFDELNNGQRFYARYDRRHDISLVGTYRLSAKILFSGVWVYGSGNALTLPTASFDATEHALQGGLQTGGSKLADYGGWNGFRAAAYHRLDLSVQLHKDKKWGTRYWEFGLYNAYSRRNPFYYQIATDNTPAGAKTTIRRVSLFPIIPSVSYNFKF